MIYIRGLPERELMRGKSSNARQGKQILTKVKGVKTLKSIVKDELKFNNLKMHKVPKLELLRYMQESDLKWKYHMAQFEF